LIIKIIGLEEHFTFPDVLQAWQSFDPRWQDFAVKPSSEGDGERRLLEFGPERTISKERRCCRPAARLQRAEQLLPNDKGQTVFFLFFIRVRICDNTPPKSSPQRTQALIDNRRSATLARRSLISLSGNRVIDGSSGS